MGSALYNKVSKDFERYRNRLLSFVTILPNGCWRWDGNIRKNRTGDYYGRISIRVNAHATGCWVHRVSYMAFNERDIPYEYDIDHHCVYTLCINPEHLKSKPMAKNRGRRTR